MKKLGLYIILFFTFFGLSAQEKSAEVKIDNTTIVKKQFDTSSIDRYKNDSAFNYDVVDDGPSLYEQVTAWFNRVLRKILSWFFDDIETPMGFLMVFLKALPYIIGVIVL